MIKSSDGGKLNVHQPNGLSRLLSDSQLQSLVKKSQQNQQILFDSRRFLPRKPNEKQSGTKLRLYSQTRLDLFLISDRLSHSAGKQNDSESSGDGSIHENTTSSIESNDLTVQLKNLKRSKERLEQSLKSAKDREENHKSAMHRLQQSKVKIEQHLLDAVDHKENLENEIRALATVNARLVKQLYLHHEIAQADNNDGDVDRPAIGEIYTEKECRDQCTRILQNGLTADILGEAEDMKKMQWNDMMRQAASVENHLLLSLERLNGFQESRPPLENSEQDIPQALVDVESKLEAAESLSRQQQSRVDTLEQKENRLIKEVQDLASNNIDLKQQLDAAGDEIEQLTKSLGRLSNDLSLSRNEASATQTSLEQIYKYNRTLEETVQKRQKVIDRANQRLRGLNLKLGAVSRKNKQVADESLQSKSALDMAMQENLKLQAMAETSDRNFKIAEDSLISLNSEHKSFSKDSKEKARQMEKKKRSLESERDKLKERLELYDLEIRRLIDVSLSVRQVLHSLSTMRIMFPPSSNQSPVAGISISCLPDSTNDSSHHEASELIEELGALQDNMGKIHSILSRVGSYDGLSPMSGHLKRDSGVELQNRSHSRLSFSRPFNDRPRRAATTLLETNPRDLSVFAGSDVSSASMVHNFRVRNSPNTISSTSSSQLSVSPLQAGTGADTSSPKRGSSPDQTIEDIDTDNGTIIEEEVDPAGLGTAESASKTRDPKSAVIVQVQRASSIGSRKPRAMSSLYSGQHHELGTYMLHRRYSASRLITRDNQYLALGSQLSKFELAEHARPGSVAEARGNRFSGFDFSVLGPAGEHISADPPGQRIDQAQLEQVVVESDEQPQDQPRDHLQSHPPDPSQENPQDPLENHLHDHSQDRPQNPATESFSSDRQNSATESFSSNLPNAIKQNRTGSEKINPKFESNAEQLPARLSSGRKGSRLSFIRKKRSTYIETKGQKVESINEQFQEWQGSSSPNYKKTFFGRFLARQLLT